jgi:hypothetical protein
MCKMVLLIAFMVINPFGFPDWVISLAWVGLVIDLILCIGSLFFNW